MDPITIGLLAGGGLGLLKGQQNEKMNAQNAEYRRAALKYAPWTGMGDPGQQMLPTGLESALQGAATGGMIGGMLGKGGAAGAAGAGVAAANAGGTPAAAQQPMAPMPMAGEPAPMGGMMPMYPKYSMMNPYQQMQA